MSTGRADEIVDRRAAIRDKAATLFASQGIGDASMSDLAEAVGIRKASLYYFIPSKQDLLMEVLRPVVEEPYRDLRSIVESGAELSQRFREGAAALGDLFERQPERMEILVRGRLERHLSEEHMDEIRRWKAAYTDLWRALIAEGVRGGVFRPCDDKIASFAVIGALNWMYAWFSPSSPQTGADVARQIGDHFLRGLLAVPEQRTEGGDR
jgi:AcrR family transcriptional regulator